MSWAEVDGAEWSWVEVDAQFSNSIVIRNGKIVWKHGPNRPFFLYNLSSENY